MIKRFISYYGPHKKLFALDMFCALIVAVAGLFYPTIARDIINDYAHRDELAPLFFWSAVLLAIYILKALCNYVVGYLGHVVGVRMQRDMRSFPSRITMRTKREIFSLALSMTFLTFRSLRITGRKTYFFRC